MSAAEIDDTRPGPAPARSAAAEGPRLGRGMPLVPPGTIATRALVTVIAIMTFLAAITAGAVELVASASSEWRASVAREVTIQVRPRAGRDIDADVERAAEIARRTPGIAGVRPFTRAESEKLLEPWLGSGLQLGDLAVPRMIVLSLDGSARVDLSALRRALGDAAPGATLDDHRLWIERLQAMAGATVAIGIVVVLLVGIATALAVAFATQGAMAGNRTIVEILHFVGAEDQFIVREFTRHFLRLGLAGGAIGGAAAVFTIWIAGFVAGRLTSTASGDQIEAMFGSFSLGPRGYAAIFAISALVAGVTAYVSSRTVDSQLKKLFMSP